MKTYNEIKEIITKQLGIIDLKSYEAYSRKLFWNEDKTPRGISYEEVELLSPDNIDNNAFWRIAEELFQTDPVANCMGTAALSVEEANRTNLRIYAVDGFTGLIQAAHWWGDGKVGPILEIGPGYGAFKQWALANGVSEYHAVDVYPRIPDVEPTLPNGLLSPEFVSRRQYQMVIASNVFQHLSVKQRRAYYTDIASMLQPGGHFMVSMMVYDGRWPEHLSPNGEWWCCHYGQFTQVQREDDIVADLKQHFNVVRKSIWLNGKGWGVWLCQAKTS